MELTRKTDPRTFDAFATKQNSIHYSKLSFWGEFETTNGYDAEYWSFKEEQDVVATLVLLKKKTIFGTFWYIPNGPAMDVFDQDLTDKVLTLVKDEALKDGAMFVRIDSNIPRRQHDNKGDVVEGGFNHEFVTGFYEKAGFKHTGYNYGYSGYLFSRFTYVLDLEKEFDQLLEQIAMNVRNLYKKNLRRGVSVQDAGRDDLHYLVKYGKELSDKLEFKPKSLSYFQRLYDLAKEHAVYRLCVADLSVAKENLQSERTALYASIAKVEANPRKSGFVKEVRRQIEDLDKEEKDLEVLIQKNGNKIVLGAAFYLLAGDRSYNIYTYTNKDFPSFHATISFHVETIKAFREKGIRHYDFVGVSGSLDPKDPYFGLQDFKRKFGGDFVENLGEFYFKPKPKQAYLYDRTMVYRRKVERKSYSIFVKLKRKLRAEK